MDLAGPAELLPTPQEKLFWLKKALLGQPGIDKQWF